MSAQQDASIYQYLSSKGFEKAAAAFLKEAKVDKKASESAPSVADVFTFYQKTKPQNGESNGAQKRKIEEKKVVTSSSESSSDSSSSSDSDSDSEDEKPVAKPAPVNKVSAAVLKKASSSSESSDSSSSSDSDSDSEDEKPAPKKAAPAPVAAAKAAPAAAKAKAAESSDSDSSDSDSSSSSSSSSDSDSESEEEEEKPAAKKQKVESGAAAPVKKAVSTPTAKPAAKAVSATPGNGHRAYVKGLPWVASEDQLREFFVSCGEITGVELPLQEDGRSSGTAYVTFAEREHLDAALALDGSVWPGTERWLKILESTGGSRASMGGPGSQPGERPEGCDTLFVGNLPWDITEEKMYEIFGAVGEVSSVRFATSKEDNSFRGFGHVSFANADDVLEGIKLNGTDINGRAIRLDFAPPRAPRESSGGFSPSGRGGGGRGRGGDFGGRGGRGGRGRGGRDGGAPTSASKNKGSIAAGGAGGKKMTFDE